MVLRSKRLRLFIRNFPGYKRFGLVVLTPFFFLGGAALEFVMIHWTVGETNFYRTYKRTQSQEEAGRRFALLVAERNRQAIDS